jgi:dynein heavy chain, axonemal
MLEGMETTPLIMEVNNDYCRTMNKIIFNKYMEEADPNEDDLYPKNLVLPPEEKKPEPPYLGIMPLERHKGTKLVWMEHYQRP